MEITHLLTFFEMKKIFLTFLAASMVFSALRAQEPEMTEDWSQVPELVKPGKRNKPPSDAIVLYRMRGDLDNWQNRKGEEAAWKPRWCGALEVDHPGDIVSKQAFGDVQLHIEWRSPRKVDSEKTGQERGNSGVYLMGIYEIQILDSWENETYYNGQAGSIYKQSAPLVNTSRPPGKWQSYDIIFHKPEFDENGQLTEPATMTVFHNGVLIQDHFVLKGPTVYAGYPRYYAHADQLPLVLQNHGNPVRFRNIWIREL